MLGDALEYPRSGDEWLETVLVGGVLSAVGAVLVIPLVPVQGYFVRVLRSSASGGHEAPVFDDWGTLFVDGLKLLVAQLVYVLVPVAIVFVGLAVGGFGAFSEFGGTSTGATIELVGWGIILLGTLLALVAIYLVPAAIANMAYRDSFTAAFDVGTVTDAAFTTDYLVAVVLAFAVGLVLGAVGAALTVLLVGIFVTFYVQVTVYYLIGRGYAKGLGLTPGSMGGVDAGGGEVHEPL